MHMALQCLLRDSRVRLASVSTRMRAEIPLHCRFIQHIGAEGCAAIWVEAPGGMHTYAKGLKEYSKFTTVIAIVALG